MLLNFLSLAVVFHQCGLILTWNVSVQLNPHCDIFHCEQFNIVHVQAVNDSSSVHCLFAASKRIAPSIIILHSSVPSAKLSINWSLLNLEHQDPTKAIAVDGITQSYAITLLDIVEYEDIDDKADLSQATSNVTFHQIDQSWIWNLASKQPWNPTPYTLKDNEIFEVTYSGNNSDVVFSTGGHVDLKFMVSHSEQHNPTMPRIKFVPGLSLQFEISMVELRTNLSQGRFGLRLGLVSNESVTDGDDFLYSSLFSINDEVTPGIFEMINVHLDKRIVAQNSTLDPTHPPSWPAGFLQSRPVCYISGGNREIKTSRNARLANGRDLVQGSDKRKALLNNTLPYVFYGARIAQSVFNSSDPENAVGFRIQNVSFGTPDDGYYNASQFIVWTASFGFGEPPVDPLSPLLIGLLSLSTVVILGSVLFGTLLLLVLRRRNRSGQFEPLSESVSVEPVLA